MSTQCQKCGTPSKHLIGMGSIFAFSELDVLPLTAFFNKKLDTVRCVNEGCPPLPGYPTVVITFSVPHSVYVVIGSMVQDSRDEFLTGLRRKYPEPDFDIQELPSFDSLRGIAGGRLAKRLSIMNPILMASSSDELSEYVMPNWRSLTLESFAAIQVAISAPIPSVHLLAAKPSNQDPSLLQLRNKLARAQSLLWMMMVFTWPDGEDDAPPFEDDLQSFISPKVIFPEAPEMFFAMLSSLDKDGNKISPLIEYCAEAARASICAATNATNPRADKWAEIFFAHELACRAGGDKVSAKVRAMAISEKRAKSTISFRGAWDAVARRLSSVRLPEGLNTLTDIATKAGYPHLVTDIMTEGRKIEDLDAVPIAVLIEIFRSAVASAGDARGVVAASRPFAQQLLKSGRIDDLEHLGDAMLDMMGGGFDARARVDAWFCSWLKLARMPKRVLARIRETPRDWEKDLETYPRVMLLTERANAFRLLGRFDDAHTIYEEIYQTLTDELSPEDRRTARRNYAISLREIGAPDAALAILIPLLDETPAEDSARIDLLHTTATTYRILGQDEKALPLMDEAVSLAVGPRIMKATWLRMIRADMLSGLGRFDDAIKELQTVNIEKITDSLILSVELSVWASLLANDASLPAWAEERLSKLPDVASTFIKDAEARHDARLHLDSLHLLAWLHESLGEHEKALDLWQTAISTAVEVYQRPPDVVALVSVAHHAYEDGEVEKGRAVLKLVPSADASLVGGITDLSIAVNGTQRVRHALNRVAQAVITDIWQGGDWQDVRLIAELKRDVIGRARMVRRRGTSALNTEFVRDGLSDSVVGRLAAPPGMLAVLEWIDDGENIASFVTLISPNGEIGSQWLMAPDFSLSDLAKKIRKRLRDWRPGRSGDPFDLPMWVELESWLLDQLSSYLGEDTHVVVIEHADFAGIPWHVALGRRWTCSYASSWTSLLSLLEESQSSSTFSKIGVLSVPRFNESPEILASLRASVVRTQALTTAQSFELATAEERLCDRNAVEQIMAATDLTKFLCHGYVDPADGEVALMIAHNGALPLAHSVASASPFGREHRLSWKDFQTFTSAPRIILLAACSTGMSHLAGMGERLGFFGALRHIGTRAVVAPHWNIVAASVIPILDQVLENYLTSRINLAQALRSACLAAEENNSPRWHAWALALEGDWR